MCDIGLNFRSNETISLFKCHETQLKEGANTPSGPYRLVGFVMEYSLPHITGSPVSDFTVGWSFFFLRGNGKSTML